MVPKLYMSRPSNLSAAAALTLFLALSTPLAGQAWAADEAVRAEIVYRASFGRADDIKLLVEEGASPNQTNGDGVPIIALAAMRNDPESVNVIKTIVQLRGNINAADPKGQNALFYAARTGNVDALNMLLALGIDSRSFDAKGDTARVVATRADRKDIITALDEFARGQNRRVNQIRKEYQQKKQEAERAKAAKAAEIEKALNAAVPATAPATATQPAVAATAPATAATQPAAAAEPVPEPVPQPELIAISDKKSLADAENAIEQTIDVNADDSEEIKQITDAAESKSKLNAELDNSSAPPPQDINQQSEFDLLIKNTITADPIPAMPEELSASDVAGIEKVVKNPNAKTPEQIAAEKAKAQAEREEREAQRKKEIKELAYDIALHTCAFQYWAYVLQVRQSSELGSEELMVSIQSNKDRVETLQRKLLVDYRMPQSFYDNITKSAQLRIYNQLNKMPSNRMRHEYGVGKMDDMKARCEEIARQWGFPAQLKTVSPGKFKADQKPQHKPKHHPNQKHKKQH